MTLNRRCFLISTISTGMVACAKKANWSDEPQLTDDEPCEPTVSNIEGPFYITDAPFRNDFRIWDDEGIPISISGKVLTQDCTQAFPQAIIEFWQSDPSGNYDNDSTEKRYRGTIQVAEDGKYSLSSYLPGLYLNGTKYRPHHIHVKIWDSLGNELLTTQLYFKGDPYLIGDSFFHESLVMSFEGSFTTSITATNIDFVV